MTLDSSKVPPESYFEEQAALQLLVPRAKVLAALADALETAVDPIGALALEELMQLGYTVEAGAILPPRDLPEQACQFFGVRPIARPTPTHLAGRATYVEARICSICDHIGINDASSTISACSKCNWNGDTPTQDECPSCHAAGAMTAACPECRSRYILVASTDFAAKGHEAPTAPVPAPIAWPVARDELQRWAQFAGSASRLSRPGDVRNSMEALAGALATLSARDPARTYVEVHECSGCGHQNTEYQRAQFELAYAVEWAKSRDGGDPPEQLAAQVKTWRSGNSYGNDLPRLRFGWEGYQWAMAGCGGLAQIEGPTLSLVERQALDALCAVALAARHVADDSPYDGNGTVPVEHSDMEALIGALDKLDSLPDDQSGYLMDPAAKAAWALRRLLDAPPALEAPAALAAKPGGMIAVPFDLVVAACSAIDKKRDAPKILAELRRYTTGDLSRAQAAPAAPVTPAAAMAALKAAFAADPEYAWSWHCGAWACAHDEGLATDAANRAAARLMYLAFGCDTSKNQHFRDEHRVAAPAAPTSDTALLDAMTQHRIALVPENEGPWDAEVYGDTEATPMARATGATPREALSAAVAALPAALDAMRTAIDGKPTGTAVPTNS